MEKISAIKEAIDIICPNAAIILHKYAISTKKYSTLTIEHFISTVSKKEYNLKIELNISAETTSRLLKELFPSRKSSIKPCSWILLEVGLKFCSSCSTVKPIEEFRQNNTRQDNLQSLCKECHLESITKTQAFRQSLYRANKLQRTPKWANLEKIKEIYYNCPKGCHVDHIIPLNGKNVSGLHIPENLQYLSAKDNCSKSNKFSIS